MSSDFLKSQRTTVRYPTDFLIGDLLVKAGVLRSNQLEEAVRLAGNKKINLGQMLVIARHLTNRDLQAAVDAQSMIRDRKVDMNTAVLALKTACRAGITFAEALKENGHIKQVNDSPTNKLGELLLEANVIDREQFGKAMQRSMSTGLPLGRILVLNGAIIEPLLTAALEIQVRVRDEMMTRDEALEFLRANGHKTAEESTSVEQALQIQSALKSPRGKAIRLGELLVLAGMLHDSDVINALELALANDLQIGQVIVNQGFITPELLDAALRLQELVDKGLMDGVQAADSLKEIQSNALSINDVVEYVEANQGLPIEVNFAGLLTLSRIVSVDDIVNAFDTARNDPEMVASILCMTGYMNEAAASAALRCYSLIGTNHLNQDDALVALDFCLQKQAEGEATFDEALQELGWSLDEPLPSRISHDSSIAEVSEELTLVEERISFEEPLADEGLTPESEMANAQPEMETPEPELAMPEPELAMAEMAMLEPELEFQEPELATPEPELETQEPELATPEPELAMPEPELATPEPELAIPEPELATPEPELAIPEPELATPEPELATPEPEPEVIESAPEHPAFAAKTDAAPLRPITPLRKPLIPGKPPSSTESKPTAAQIDKNKFTSGFVKGSLPIDAPSPDRSYDSFVPSAETTFESAFKAAEPELFKVDNGDSSFDLDIEASDTSDNLPAIGETRGRLNETVSKPFEEELLKEENASHFAFQSEEMQSAGFDRHSLKEFTRTGTGLDAMDPSDDWLAPVETEPFEPIADEAVEEVTFDSAEDSLAAEAAEEFIVQMDANGNISGIVLDDTSVDKQGDDTTGSSVSSASETKQVEPEQPPALAARRDSAEGLRSLTRSKPQPGQSNGKGVSEPVNEELPVVASAEIEPAKSSADSIAAYVEEAAKTASVGNTNGSAETAEASEAPAQKGNAASKMSLKNLLQSYAAQSGDNPVVEVAPEEPAAAVTPPPAEMPTGNGHAKHAAVAAKASLPSDELVLSSNDQAILAAAASLTATPEQIKEAALLLAAHQQASVVAKATPAAVGAVKQPVQALTGPAVKPSVPTTNRPSAPANRPPAPSTAAPLKSTSANPALGASKPHPGSIAARLKAAEKPTAENPVSVATDVSMGGLKADSIGAVEEESKKKEPSGTGEKIEKIAEPETAKAKEEEVNAQLGDAFVRLAESYYEQGNYAEAEQLYARILNLREKEDGLKSPTLLSALNNLAGVMCVQGKFEEAEVYVQRCVNILETHEPDDILRLADGLNTLAGIYYQQDKFDQCEPLLERALRLRQRALGEDHPDIADNLRDYAKFLKKVGRAEEAEKMYAQAKAILSQALKKATH